jgi:hypothetical protein
MGEDGAGNALLLAPAQLFGDRRVPDLVVVAPAHHRSHHGGPIADIERHAVKRVMALTDGREVWNIEEGDTASAHAIADGGSEQ